MPRAEDRTDWFVVAVEHHGYPEDVEKLRALLESELRLTVDPTIRVHSTQKLSLKFSDKGGFLRWTRTKKKA